MLKNFLIIKAFINVIFLVCLFWGCFFLENMFTSNIPRIEDKRKALVESIQQRLQDLTVKDLLTYKNKKVCFTLKKGRFSQGMVWKGTLLNATPLAIKLQPYFLSIYPEWAAGIGLVVQIVYIFFISLSSKGMEMIGAKKYKI